MVDARKALLEDIAKELKAKCNIIKQSFFRDDGTILLSSMSLDNTEKMGKLVKFYSRQMQINNYFEQDSNSVHLVLYRVSVSIFLVVISESNTELITNQLMEIFKKYSKRLDILYHETPSTFKNILRYIVIGQALDMGPEPVGSYPEDIPNEIRMKVAMKSMLLLTAEKEGAVRGIPAIIPFLEYNSIGVLYLFDVPNEAARGGAYDSCISILVDESYRPVIYENMYAIETACVEAVELIKLNGDFAESIEYLIERLDGIDLRKMESRGKSHEIEGIMKEQIKRLSKEIGR
ncbi:MAG TPA: hypothetical protein VKM55_11450 [Candidatus Lokiarchaeia archaeon]|nr:hypothetical protein [Candidatus Lokiarchaeia archaeon]